MSLFLVNNLCVLQKGDHIKWKRPVGYDHHALVESVDPVSGKVRVIEYGSDNSGSGFGKGTVRKQEVSGVKGMYKYKYDICDDADEVVQKAKERIGERKYNPFTSNCEHFATMCKTGKKKCSQLSPFIARAFIALAEAGYGGLATVTGRCVAKCAIAAAEKGTTILRELKGLLTCGNTKKVLNAIRENVATGGKAIHKNGLKCCTKAGPL